MISERNEKRDTNLSGRFLERFLLNLSLFFYAAQAPLSLLQGLKAYTASAVAGFWSALSVSVIREGIYVTFFAFTMEITLECTALHYVAIYSAGVLAYRAHSLSYRLAGILIGTAVIFLLNVLRIGMLGVVGHYSNNIFEFVHVYLWQGTFALMVLMVWILWVRGRGVPSPGLLRSVLTAFAAASASFVTLYVFLAHYAQLLAAVANAVYGIVAAVNGVEIASFAERKAIGYASPRGIIYNNISIDVMNAVIFVAIAAVTAHTTARVVTLKRAALGGGLLFFQHLAYVVVYGIILVRGMEPDAFAVLLWFTRGFSMAAPLLIWLLVTTIFRPSLSGEINR